MDGLKDLKNWHKLFTSRLVGDVKLVGPTISCGFQIHVQSHFFALEKEGLDIAWVSGVFMSDGKSINELIKTSEFGMTSAIFKSGYTIDCLMMQYATYDWRKIWLQSKGGQNACNTGYNPNQDGRYGSKILGKQYSLSSLETVFYKRGGSVHEACTISRYQGEFQEKYRCTFDVIIDDQSKWIMNYLKARNNSINTIS